MFDSDSRYATVGDYEVPGPDGKPVTIKKVRFIPATPATLTHAVTNADRPDLLAFAYYREPERYWQIGDANEILELDELTSVQGRRILIPPRS